MSANAAHPAPNTPIYPNEYDALRLKFDIPVSEDGTAAMGKIWYNDGQFFVQVTDLKIPFAASGPYKQKEHQIMDGGKYSVAFSLNGHDHVGSQEYSIYNLVRDVEARHQEFLYKNRAECFEMDPESVTPKLISSMYTSILKNDPMNPKKPKKGAPPTTTSTKVYPPNITTRMQAYPNKDHTALRFGGKYRNEHGGDLSGEQVFEMLNDRSVRLQFTGILTFPFSWSAKTGFGIQMRMVQGVLSVSQQGLEWMMRDDLVAEKPGCDEDADHAALVERPDKQRKLSDPSV